KVLSLLTAAIMGAACFNMNAAAETSFAAGDVDMDGIVTGHDTAMVSRYLVTDGYTLTDEQLALADVDGDGEVTQADADKLYNEMQVYRLGNVLYEETSEFEDLDDASAVHRWYMKTYEGMDYNIELDEVQLNIADVNADGKVDKDDVELISKAYAVRCAGMEKILTENNIYYYSLDPDNAGYLENGYSKIGDVDMDGIVTGHDTAMVSRYLVTDGYTLTDEQLALADVDGDGEVTQADADKLYNEMQVYPIGLVLYSEKDYISIDDGDVILKYIANTGAGIDYPMTQIQMNLADIDADGNVTLDDATLDLTIYAMRHAGMHKELDARTVYYYTFEENDPGFLNNIN
ncbi:MAG: dockerin type I repeat-containing protein, partial [Oscillospiraceae bacterium]|nr:dockerin type I repeat-containing protein [Oscillospiraceae bacterium]